MDCLCPNFYVIFEVQHIDYKYDNRLGEYIEFFAKVSRQHCIRRYHTDKKDIEERE